MEFFQNELFSIADYTFRVGYLVRLAVLLGGLTLLYLLTMRRLLPYFFERTQVSEKSQHKTNRIMRWVFLFGLLTGLIWAVGMNYTLYETEEYALRVTTIMEAFLILQLARLADWTISRIVLRNYEKQTEQKNRYSVAASVKDSVRGTATRAIQYLAYAFAVLFLVKLFDLDACFEVLGRDIFVSNIIAAIMVLLFAQLISWLIVHLLLQNYYKNKRINLGAQFAINQLLRYIIFFIGILIAIENLGLQLTVIWGGAAALLVGVGLGLQQTFNDLISGIILLFERSVEVGDIVEIEGLVGTVRKIGMRTSLVETRNNITVVVPNSKLIVDNVINWSHYDNKARFNIKVGVAYGTDTQLVREVLLNVASSSTEVMKYPSAFVRFVDFGDSSLDFELHFWAKDFIGIENVKSDLRFEIDQAFRENDIQIPFPQRDVWFRNSMEGPQKE